MENSLFEFCFACKKWIILLGLLETAKIDELLVPATMVHHHYGDIIIVKTKNYMVHVGIAFPGLA